MVVLIWKFFEIKIFFLFRLMLEFRVSFGIGLDILIIEWEVFLKCDVFRKLVILSLNKYVLLVLKRDFGILMWLFCEFRLLRIFVIVMKLFFELGDIRDYLIMSGWLLLLKDWVLERERFL